MSIGTAPDDGMVWWHLITWQRKGRISVTLTLSYPLLTPNPNLTLNPKTLPPKLLRAGSYVLPSVQRWLWQTLKTQTKNRRLITKLYSYNNDPAMNYLVHLSLLKIAHNYGFHWTAETVHEHYVTNQTKTFLSSWRCCLMSFLLPRYLYVVFFSPSWMFTAPGIIVLSCLFSRRVLP